MKQLNQNILNWAEEKGIIAKSNAPKQLKKTMEEFIETVMAIAKLHELRENFGDNDVIIDQVYMEKVKDGVGDIYVTLVIHAYLAGCSFPDTLDENYDIGNSNGKTCIELIGEHILQLAKFPQSYIYSDMVFLLSELAKEYGLTLRECVQHSYDIVSKRTGAMVDGIFVKNN